MQKTQMPETCVVLITCESEEEARRIGRQLVEERLAACANLVGQIESIFHWKGEIQEEDEALLILKTRRSHFERLAARVEALHSYEVPEVVALPIMVGLAPYVRWIAEETGKSV